MDIKKINKRGQVQDLLTFMTSLFAIAVFLTIMWKIGDGMQSALVASEFYDNTTADAIASLDKTAKMGDFAFGFILLGLFLLLIITAVFIPVSVIYTTIFLIVGAVLWFMSIPLSNAYSALVASSALSSMPSNMPLTYIVMTKLPLLSTMVLVLLMVILFGKRYLFSEETGGI